MQGMMPLFLSVLAGVSLFASANHFIISLKTPKENQEHVSFSVLCFVFFILVLSIIGIFRSETLIEYRDAIRYSAILAPLYYLALMWFSRILTNTKENNVFPILFLAYVFFSFRALTHSYGGLVERMDGIYLPEQSWFGHHASPINPIYSTWAGIYLALIYISLFYIVYCAASGFIKNRQQGSAFLLINTIVYILLMTLDIYNLVKYDTVTYLAIFCFLPFIFLMSTHMTGAKHASLVAENEEKYRRLIETIRNDYIVYSFTAEGKFIYLSPSVEKILGYSKDEILTQGWKGLNHFSDIREALKEHFDLRNKRKEDIYQFELDAYDANGHKVIFDVFHHILRDKSKNIIAIEGFARDITKQRQYENKLLEFNAELEFRANERTEELQSALSELRKEVSEKHFLEQQLMQAQKMESIGQLAGGVAHDFNNIMTAIAGFSELAINDSHKGKNVSMDLEQILEAANRGSKLTEQLLSFARKQIAVPQVINPNEVLEDAMKFLPRMLSGKAELLFNPNPDVWPIKIDPVQFDQIIINLVVNARDAMSEGLSDNEIILEVHNFQFEQAQALTPLIIPEQEYVCLSVTDTGKGIPSELHQKIFEPFFTTKAIGKGSGLGLSVCYGVVKQYGGYIFVDSDVGEGTTFYILFPRVMVSGINFPKRQTLNDLLSDSSGGNETLLLVEDDPAVAMLTQKILMSSGYRVLTAVNGLDALDVAEKNSGAIDLVVTDVMMPKMDGKELVDTLRLLSPSIEIICVSGFADSDVIAELRKKNVTFLAKPYTPLQLVKIVRTVLNQRSIKSGLSHPA